MFDGLWTSLNLIVDFLCQENFEGALILSIAVPIPFGKGSNSRDLRHLESLSSSTCAEEVSQAWARALIWWVSANVRNGGVSHLKTTPTMNSWEILEIPGKYHTLHSCFRTSGHQHTFAQQLPGAKQGRGLGNLDIPRTGPATPSQSFGFLGRAFRREDFHRFCFWIRLFKRCFEVWWNSMKFLSLAQNWTTKVSEGS